MKSPTRILIVEDEASLAELYSLILHQAGYQVSTAPDGATARKSLRAAPPAVVLLDVMLPDMNGGALCQEIKQDPAFTDVFVALCSGAANSGAHKAAGLDGGADDYLTKPMTPEELLARLRNLVRLRETTVALRASERQFRQLVEALPDGVLRCDAETRLLTANPRAQLLLGITNPAELLGQSLFDLVHREDRNRAQAELARIKAGDCDAKLELRLQPPGRSPTPVELRIVPVSDAPAPDIGFVAVLRDLHDRRQEEARRAIFAKLGKQLSEANTAKAAAQIIVECADQLLGWDCCYVRLVSDDPDEMLPVLAYDVIEGRRTELSVADFPLKMSPVSRLVLAQGGLLLNSDSAPNGEGLSPFGDTGRPSESRLFTVMRKGNLPLGIISIQSYQPRAYGPEDLDLLQALADYCGGALERIRMAEALRESEERFRSLFESAPIGLALHDAHGHYLVVNPAYEDMLGYSQTELRRRGVKGVTVAEDIPAGRQFFAELKSGNRNYYRRQKRYLRQDGQIVWAEASATAIRNTDGQLRYIVSMVADITARKEADEAIRALNESLEQRVRERTADLAAVNAALRQREEQLRLALDASHAGTWAWDARTQTVHWDTRYHEIYGFAPDAEISFATWINQIHPEDRTRLLTRIETLRQNPADNLWNEEFRALHPERGEVWMAGLGQVVRDAEGQLIQMMGINLDITRRRQAEAKVRHLNETLEQRVRERTAELEQSNAALRESELRFQQLATSIREVFWMSDPTKQQMIYVSPGYESIWERSCASLLAAPHTWLEAIHPEDRERVWHAAQTKQVSGNYDEEYRILRRDGSLRWIRDRAYPVHTPEGRVTRVVGVAEDITQRRAAEEALRETEIRKAAILESALDAIITLDAQGLIVEANPAAEKMFGHSRRRLLQHPFEVLVNERLRPWFRRGLATGFAGESGPHLNCVTEMPALRAGNLEFPVEFTLTRIAVSSPVLFTAFLRDVTVQRRNEEQIRLLADAVQSTRESVSVTDARHQFIFVNQAFEATYGYRSHEVLGKTPALLYPAAIQSVFEEVHRQTLAGGWQGELVHQRKDGSTMPVSLSTSVIKNRHGTPVGLVGVSRDISDRKRAEKQTTAFALLGHRLSGVTTVSAAAETILQVASILFHWDACFLHLINPADHTIMPILTMDTLNGQRCEVPSNLRSSAPTPIMRSVLEHGPRLINRTPDQLSAPELVTFGDRGRLSASLMFVPIHSDNIPVGILSLQSYTPKAYHQADLQLLQILADHCGNALRRIDVAETLRRTEAKYRDIVENASEGIFQTTPEGRYLSANPAQARILGYNSVTELLATVTNIEKQTYAVPEQRQELRRLLETQGRVQGFEVERIRKDGQRIWTSINGHVVRDASGKVAYYECTSQDITHRKHAELELRRLPHLIIEAQELERQRVAQELHDGVNQLIAAAKMRLSKLNEQRADFGPATREILNRCESLMIKALEENRRIAHNLRPSDLDHLGLAETCRNYCRELAHRTNLRVRFRTTGLETRLAAHLELNLFRILQEATNNIHQHARAKSVHVSLTAQAKHLVLKIRDDGCGFEVGKSKRGKKPRTGVGLTNMRERVAAIGGECEVCSVPNQGTTILVRVAWTPNG